MKAAQDVVDYLLTASGGGAQDGEHRAVRQAVIHAYRDVVQCRQWLWHTKTEDFLAQNVTAAITGATAGSKIFTVANADNLVAGRLVTCDGIVEEPCRIEAVSGNIVTLDRPSSQDANASSGLTLKMQTFFDLPRELRDIDALVSHTVGTLHCYLTPQEWHRLEINTRGTGEPYYYTIMRSDKEPDRYQIRFVGMPTNGTVIHYTYRYTPKEIKYMGYERLCRQGTVSASGTTVTGTGTSFPEDIVGSVIRFGTTNTEADPVGSLAPFVHERRIIGRASPTSLTIDSPLEVPALTKYALTDQLDVSPVMYTAILSAAEMWYARLAGKPGDAAVQMAMRDLRLAMEQDVVSPLSGRPNHLPYPTPRTMGWSSEPLPDVL